MPTTGGVRVGCEVGKRSSPITLPRFTAAHGGEPMTLQSVLLLEQARRIKALPLYTQTFRTRESRQTFSSRLPQSVAVKTRAGNPAGRAALTAATPSLFPSVEIR